MQLQLGWKAGTEQYPPEQLLEYAIAAEKAGFDSIDVSDHFHPWSERGQACFVWTWLGAAAAKTNRIILGTGVTCPILRYHQAIVARRPLHWRVWRRGARFSASAPARLSTNIRRRDCGLPTKPDKRK